MVKILILVVVTSWSIYKSFRNEWKVCPFTWQNLLLLWDKPTCSLYLAVHATESGQGKQNPHFCLTFIARRSDKRNDFPFSYSQNGQTSSADMNLGSDVELAVTIFALHTNAWLMVMDFMRNVCKVKDFSNDPKIFKQSRCQLVKKTSETFHILFASLLPATTF